MNFNESLALQLISEMKKPGRECLYDKGNKSYKNNHTKQCIWSTIATSIGMGRIECQALWKSLRRRYKTAKSKSSGRSGSERFELKGFLKVLVSEMDYFQKFLEDDEPNDSLKDRSPSVCSAHSTSKEAHKRSRLADAENEYEESLRTLNTLASSVIQSAAEKVDPFFLSLQEEFLKVPEYQKSALKLKLMALVIEHQSN